MKPLIFLLAITASVIAGETRDFISRAREKHGEFGEKAARFLVDHMPADDREKLSADFLTENLDLALKARATFPWAAKVSEAVFLNDVLPYAVFDEPRDPWRADFMKMATPIVAGANSASEAAQALNRELFKQINVHYHTGRKRTNQSPAESIAQGKATCTGLSIILVDACRSVGIPARAVGTPLWTNGRVNHTWTEIHDQGEWHFTGSDEYNAKGLNRAWFTGDAAKADATSPIHAIYATSWKKEGVHFPMTWSPRNHSVAAVNVTARYAKAPEQGDQLGVRLHDGAGNDTRIAATGSLIDEETGAATGFTTKAGTTDLNDMPRLKVTPCRSYRVEFTIGGTTYQSSPFQAEKSENTLDLRLDELRIVKPDATGDGTDAANPDAPLGKQQAAATVRSIYREIVAAETAARSKELEEKSITHGEHTLRWLEKTFGDAPADGRSLWISMHGGGGAPKQLNDRQWKNQIGLYQPKEGIYVAPRAPTNSWNLWSQPHIDALFSRLIEDMVALRGVNPDKVYLMGYSAGGDGVWQLGPRMADRFAAASMMAGHPNGVKLDSLRNLPFGIFMGAEDSAYNRNKIAARKTLEIEKLHEADPAGYPHMSRIYKGLPHWMNRKDAEAVPWMAGFTRRTWPDKIVWLQGSVTHNRFYWLEMPEGGTQNGRLITATAKNNEIHIDGEIPPGTRLLLNDALVDLDRDIRVTVNGAEAVTYRPARSAAAIRDSLRKRLDPQAAATAVVVLN
ncbi:MAG: transglutaminase domain-containing protein [Verrucomicrobiales bacterium]